MAGAGALIGINELAEDGTAESGGVTLGDAVHLIGGASKGIEFDEAKAVAQAAIS